MAQEEVDIVVVDSDTDLAVVQTESVEVAVVEQPESDLYREEVQIPVALEVHDVIVVAAGQQGPEGAQGPVGPAGGTVNISKTNGDTQNLDIGTPVYLDTGSNTVKRARANNATTTRVFGLLAQDIAQAASGIVQVFGVMAASTADWDAVTGQTGGLTPGVYYYCSADTAGKLTVTPPSTEGQYVARVGWGVSSTEMHVDVEPSVLL